MEEMKSSLYGGSIASRPMPSMDKPAATLGNRLQELQERLNGIAVTSSELADRIGGSSMVGSAIGEKTTGGPEANDFVAIATRIVAIADRIERSLSRAYNSL